MLPEIIVLQIPQFHVAKQALKCEYICLSSHSVRKYDSYSLLYIQMTCFRDSTGG